MAAYFLLQSKAAGEIFLRPGTQYGTVQESANGGSTWSGNQALQSIINNDSAGTTYKLVSRGASLQNHTFRGWEVNPKAEMKFIGTDASEYNIVLSGAKVLDANDATQDSSGRWYWTGQTQQNPVQTNVNHGECKDHKGQWTTEHRNDCYPEDLFVNGSTLLKHENSLGALGSGEWYFDYAANRIYMFDNPSGYNMIEIGATPGAFAGSRDNNPGVLIENVIVEKYAVTATAGAIGFFNNNFTYDWTVRYSELRYNHGAGIFVGPGSKVEYSNIHHNGQEGLKGRGLDPQGQRNDSSKQWPIYINNNEIHHNKTLSYMPGWEAGAFKFAETNGMEFKNNWSHHNHAWGAWWDVNNRNALIENNLVEDNDGPGIFFELSGACGGNQNICNFLPNNPTRIRWNIVKNNAHIASHGQGYGLIVSDSRDVVVSENYLEDNKKGLYLNGGSRRNVENVYFENNDIHVANGGIAAEFYDRGNLIGDNNGFRNNKYRVSDSSNWRWLRNTMDINQWNNQGLNNSEQKLASSKSGSLPIGVAGHQMVQSGTYKNSGEGGVNQDVVSPNVNLAAPNTNAVVSGVNVSFLATAFDDVGVVRVEFQVDGVTFATDNTAPYEVSWDSTSANDGVHTFNARAYDAVSNSASSSVSASVNNGSGVQSPFVSGSHLVPGQIEAEAFDNGGEGVAYHDVEVENRGDSTYRNEGVDIKKLATTDHRVGFAAVGEWLEYMIDVQQTGEYEFTASAASIDTGATIHAEINGTDATGAITIPNTGSYDIFESTQPQAISLSAGSHVLRVTFDSSPRTFLGDFDWFNLEYVGPETTALLGDFDNNSTVDIFDLSFLLVRWNTNDSSADLNGDGSVSIFDLSILLSNYGR